MEHYCVEPLPRAVQVRGWNKKPRKTRIRRDNIEKALESIRNLKNMGKRHAEGWKYSRGAHPYIGYFEDLHRFSMIYLRALHLGSEKKHHTSVHTFQRLRICRYHIRI